MEYMSVSMLRKQYALGTAPRSIINEIISRSKQLSDYNIWITAPDMSFIEPYLERLDKMNRELPLWGIPFAVKDNIDLEGVPTTAACPDYAYTPSESAEVVKRLVSAGAVPIGKTNMDQFATGLVGTRSPYGECKNAINPDYISGGSSSGSAVAVALGLCAFSLGTDTAGSGRVPAALNGIYGLKPSVSAWPKKGLVPACESLDCITAFAAELDDAMLVDSLARGYCEDDIWSERVEKKVEAPNKILVPDSALEFYGDFAEMYKTAYENAVSVLSQKFAVEEIPCDIFTSAADLLYNGPWICERWSALGDFVTSHRESIFPVTKKILMSGRGEDFSAAYLFEKQHLLRKYKHESDKLLDGAVLALPTCGGTFTRSRVREDPIECNSKMGLYTNHCNLLNLSALAVPFGEFEAYERSFPFGITFFAAADKEGMLEYTARKCCFKNKTLNYKTDLREISVI